MVFISPLQSDSELQWDEDSAPNKGYNCGPASAEKIANYYKDLLKFGINRTRMLGTSRTSTGTNTTEQSRMLTLRGIPNTVQQLDAPAIKGLLKTTRRPIILWLVMAGIPDSIKGHSFDGRHAVAALANGIVNGETGIWVNEPDQRRASPRYKKNRFFPDKYWIPASKAIGRWVIVPDKDKVIPTRRPLKKKWVVTAHALTIRSGPSAATGARGVLVQGNVFTSNLIELKGGKYKKDGKIYDNWLGFVRDGKQRWVAKAYCKEA